MLDKAPLLTSSAPSSKIHKPTWISWKALSGLFVIGLLSLLVVTLKADTHPWISHDSNIQSVEETPVQSVEETPVQSVEETPVQSMQEMPGQPMEETPVQSMEETPVGKVVIHNLRVSAEPVAVGYVTDGGCEHLAYLGCLNKDPTLTTDPKYLGPAPDPAEMTIEEREQVIRAFDQAVLDGICRQTGGPLCQINAIVELSNNLPAYDAFVKEFLKRLKNKTKWDKQFFKPKAAEVLSTQVVTKCADNTAYRETRNYDAFINHLRWLGTGDQIRLGNGNNAPPLDQICRYFIIQGKIDDNEFQVSIQINGDGVPKIGGPSDNRYVYKVIDNTRAAHYYYIIHYKKNLVERQDFQFMPRGGTGNRNIGAYDIATFDPRYGENLLGGMHRYVPLHALQYDDSRFTTIVAFLFGESPRFEHIQRVASILIRGDFQMDFGQGENVDPQTDKGKVVRSMQEKNVNFLAQQYIDAFTFEAPVAVEGNLPTDATLKQNLKKLFMTMWADVNNKFWYLEYKFLLQSWADICTGWLDLGGKALPVTDEDIITGLAKPFNWVPKYEGERDPFTDIKALSEDPERLGPGRILIKPFIELIHGISENLREGATKVAVEELPRPRAGDK